MPDFFSDNIAVSIHASTQEATLFSVMHIIIIVSIHASTQEATPLRVHFSIL